MTQTKVSLEQAIQQLSKMHSAFMFSQVLFAFVLVIQDPPIKELPAGFVIPFFAIAMLNVGLAMLWSKKQLVGDAEERLRLDPDDLAARLDLFRGLIISWALCESSGLFGFVLRFLGIGWKAAGPLFVLAIVGLQLCTPRRP